MNERSKLKKRIMKTRKKTATTLLRNRHLIFNENLLSAEKPFYALKMK